MPAYGRSSSRCKSSGLPVWRRLRQVRFAGTFSLALFLSFRAIVQVEMVGIAAEVGLIRLSYLESAAFE